MPSVKWSGVKPTIMDSGAIETCSLGDELHFTFWQFGGRQENATCPNADKPLGQISPFFIQKGLEGLAGSPKSLDLTRLDNIVEVGGVCTICRINLCLTRNMETPVVSKGAVVANEEAPETDTNVSEDLAPMPDSSNSKSHDFLEEETHFSSSADEYSFHSVESVVSHEERDPSVISAGEEGKLDSRSDSTPEVSKKSMQEQAKSEETSHLKSEWESENIGKDEGTAAGARSLFRQIDAANSSSSSPVKSPSDHKRTWEVASSTAPAVQSSNVVIQALKIKLKLILPSYHKDSSSLKTTERNQKKENNSSSFLQMKP
ncbi:uncharacterized protein LOC143233845 [Tachypleus tridentatus]|uniref:uncharacterized protein LOC143233845 n=1 Tax=Tachypleus tridentatus TaxID=6853 RepID=UPI003FCF80F8